MKIVRQFHLLSDFYPLFVSFKTNIYIYIWILIKSGPVIEILKSASLFGILYQSLGLYITCVRLNPFKMASTYPILRMHFGNY